MTFEKDEDRIDFLLSRDITRPRSALNIIFLSNPVKGMNKT